MSLRGSGPAGDLLTDIKKPACGRLLGDCLSLFLTNLSSLQIAQPTLRQAE